MASVLKVDKLDPQSGTALEIGTSGDTISIPSGATLDISASTLTPPATMPASSGINFTALNATNLGSGTVPTARLGTGSASSSVFLSGASTWIAAAGGKVLQVKVEANNTETAVRNTEADYMTCTFTPTESDSKVLIIHDTTCQHNGNYFYQQMWRGVWDSGGTSLVDIIAHTFSAADVRGTAGIYYLDSPATTSEVTYDFTVMENFDASTITINPSGQGRSQTIMLEIAA